MKCVLAILLACLSASAATVRYVDANATAGSNDGLSWANAWTNLNWLSRDSNKVVCGDTIHIAGRQYTNVGWLALKEGNVVGGVTNWTRYYFDTGPCELRCGLKVHGYTEVNGAANRDYATNLVSTYDTSKITNNINLWIRRETNWYDGGFRSVVLQELPAPVIFKWARITGSTDRLGPDPPKSDSCNEIYLQMSPAPTNSGLIEFAYIWSDRSSGHGAAAPFAFNSGYTERQFGTINIHHCLIENGESDICNGNGGVDFHHNIVRNREVGYNGGNCNDTFTMIGNVRNYRIYNNLIEPAQNVLYYLLGGVTNVANLLVYNNIFTPVHPAYQAYPGQGGGSGIMEQDTGAAGTTYYIQSNVFFFNNTWIGTTNGGPGSLINFTTKDGFTNDITVLAGSMRIENNLFVSIDTNPPSLRRPPLKFAVYGHGSFATNDHGKGWLYSASGVSVDYNYFCSYAAGDLNPSITWGPSWQTGVNLVDATAIQTTLGFANNVSATNANLLVDADEYDYRPQTADLVMAQDLTTLTNLMPDLDTDIYGNARPSGSAWTAGAIEYSTAAPVITSDPISLTVGEDDTSTFHCDAIGAPTLNFQWFWATLAATNPAPGVVGEGGETLTLTHTSTNNAGDYFVIITNAYGSATSAVATLTVTNSITPPEPPQPPVYTNGLLCWLTFEDNFPIQGYAEDYSGNGARMLNIGWRPYVTNYPTISAGKVGSQAAHFLPYLDTHPYTDPSFIIGQYGAITNLSPALNQMTQCTVAVWCRFDAIDPADRSSYHNAHLLDAGYGQVGNWYLGRYYTSTSGEIGFNVMTNTGGISSQMTTWFPSIATYYWYTNNTWTHFAATFDCTVPTNLVCILYTNGVACLTNTLYTPSFPVPYLHAVDPAGAQWGPWIGVGCWTHNGTPPLDDADELPNNGWLNGDLDDIRIYNRILNAGEVAAIVNQPSARHRIGTAETHYLISKP